MGPEQASRAGERLNRRLDAECLVLPLGDESQRNPDAAFTGLLLHYLREFQLRAACVDAVHGGPPFLIGVEDVVDELVGRNSLNEGLEQEYPFEIVLSDNEVGGAGESVLRTTGARSSSGITKSYQVKFAPVNCGQSDSPRTYIPVLLLLADSSISWPTGQWKGWLAANARVWIALLQALRAFGIFLAKRIEHIGILTGDRLRSWTCVHCIVGTGSRKPKFLDFTS